MILDFYHNKIVKDTISESFINSLTASLIPKLAEKYADMLGVQMYEDFLSEGLSSDGYAYYPLTVITDGGYEIEWIRWSVADEKSFTGGICYSYVGNTPLEFEIVDSLPEEFSSVTEGRRMYFAGDTLPISVNTVIDSVKLSGKYSQSFLDAMAYGVCREIERAMAVRGLSATGIRLEIPFAPETYMEHTSDNVTYRRLLISDKNSAAKDLWIKWTRLDSAVGYSVGNHVSENDISFELGEDVPQKIREKEYRFLTRASAAKYQAAMGRKNVTEWRELIKRAIRRGELEKVELVIEAPEATGEMNERLDAILEKIGYAQTAVQKETAPSATSDAELLDAILKAETLIQAKSEDTDETPTLLPEPEVAEQSEEAPRLADEPSDVEDDGKLPWDTDGEESENGKATAPEGEITLWDELIEKAIGEATEEATEEADAEATEEKAVEDEESIVAEILGAADDGAALNTADEAVITEDEPRELDGADTVDENLAAEESSADEVLLADEIEEEPDTLDDVLKIYGEPEVAEASSDMAPEPDLTEELAEEPTVTVDVVNVPDTVMAVGDPELAELVYKLREEKIHLETEYKLLISEKSEKITKLEEELRLVTEERDKLKSENIRLADSARRASAELEREVELHRIERDRLTAEIENHVRAEEREKNRLAEAALVEMQERRRKEEEAARAEAERLRLVEERERRLEEEKIAAEIAAEKERLDAETARAEAVKQALENVSYTSYVVKLIFRNSVDPNYITKIGEYIKTTVSYFKKDHLKIRVKASMPEPMMVQLDFTNIPDCEHELIVNIIKVLGKSNLGIVKAILD